MSDLLSQLQPHLSILVYWIETLHRNPTSQSKSIITGSEEKDFPSSHPSLLPLIQASSCGKWRSSGSRRPSTSASATTWPPSFPVASPWSTPTPRTSPSSTKATGWSDVCQEEEEAAPQSRREEKHPAANFSAVRLLSFFFLSRHISVLSCLCWEENLHAAPLSFFRKCSIRLFAFILFLHDHTHTHLVSVGFLVMKSPPPHIVIHEKRLSLKDHLFVSYLCVNV